MHARNVIPTAAAVLLALLWSAPGSAQGNCGNIEFTEAISSQFPDAEDACLGVVERDGKEYARFEAKIVRVQGSRVEAQFKLPNGEYGKTVAFTPPSSARVRIGGTTYRYRDLSPGQELDVYVPPDRWEIAVPQEPDFATAQTVEEVQLTEPSETLAAALPSTAGRLPWLTALGVALLLVSLGSGLSYRLIRERK
jgi:hypothetical protein